MGPGAIARDSGRESRVLLVYYQFSFAKFWLARNQDMAAGLAEAAEKEARAAAAASAEPQAEPVRRTLRLQDDDDDAQPATAINQDSAAENPAVAGVKGRRHRAIALEDDEDVGSASDDRFAGSSAAMVGASAQAMPSSPPDAVHGSMSLSQGSDLDPEHAPRSTPSNRRARVISLEDDDAASAPPSSDVIELD